MERAGLVLEVDASARTVAPDCGRAQCAAQSRSCRAGVDHDLIGAKALGWDASLDRVRATRPHPRRAPRQRRTPTAANPQQPQLTVANDATTPAL
jgi:hypothetical protein